MAPSPRPLRALRTRAVRPVRCGQAFGRSGSACGGPAGRGGGASAGPGPGPAGRAAGQRRPAGIDGRVLPLRRLGHVLLRCPPGQERGRGRQQFPGRVPGPGCLVRLRQAGRGDAELGCDVDQVDFVPGRRPDRRVGSRRADPRGHRGAQQAGDLGRCPAPGRAEGTQPGPAPGQASGDRPSPAVRGAGVAGSYATPDRVIPCLGQVSKYTVQAAGTEGSHVLHNDKPGV